jgi:hypothetical protein
MHVPGCLVGGRVSMPVSIPELAQGKKKIVSVRIVFIYKHGTNIINSLVVVLHEVTCFPLLNAFTTQ